MKGNYTKYVIIHGEAKGKIVTPVKPEEATRMYIVEQGDGSQLKIPLHWLKPAPRERKPKA